MLPGLGSTRALPKLAHLQRVLNKRVATEYGLEFPYVSAETMQEIELKREEWCSDAVWDYLSVPKPFRKAGYSSVMDERYDGCMLQWNYGQHIYSDKVVICRPEKENDVYFVTTVDNQGKPITLPDPRFYW